VLAFELEPRQGFEEAGASGEDRLLLPGEVPPREPPETAAPSERILRRLSGRSLTIRSSLPARRADSPRCISSPERLIASLQLAYGTRDYDLYRRLFADREDASFLFFLPEPSELGETQWGVSEELRIHRRRFHPENPLPGEEPVPAELWVRSIDITLSQLAAFQERRDLYRSPANPYGLDPEAWRATDALYATDVFWNMAGETDFVVRGRANFIVIEDLGKRLCDEGRFLLYIWEDLSSPALEQDAVSEETSWSDMKSLYR
jgi:hypothetical protein